MIALINRLASFSLVLILITAGYGCDVFLPDKGNEGQPCLDNGECKPGLVCQTGVCVEGSTDGGEGCQTDAECDDENPCTGDTCVDRDCVNENLQNGTTCDDDNTCTTDDACEEGACSGTAKDCSAMDGQCKQGVCFPENGQCVQISADDNDPCEDGLYCTTNDHCDSGNCVGTDRDCDDGDDCTEDSCDDVGDACQNTLDPSAGTTEGPVGDATCSNQVDDDCDGQTDLDDSECVACSDNADCDDDNACTTDTCDTDQCTYQDVVNGTSCDDGQYCTVADACVNGVCTGSAMDCRQLSDACNDGVCSEAQSSCVTQPKANGTPCDDGLFCTVPDLCDNGVCQLDAMDCDDSDSCTTDACDEDNDRCTNTLVPIPGAEGPQGDTTCNNSLDDDCDGQTDLDDSDCVDCQSANDCDDANNCTLDECQAGGCTNTPQVGQGCDDGDDCTHTDECLGDGSCQGTAIACVDGPAPCGVVRTCNGTANCDETHPNGTPCDDTDPCTHTDQCDGAGVCAGTVIVCDDDPATCGLKQSCNGTAACDQTYPDATTSCDDTDPCTYNDACNGSGDCVGTDVFCTGDDPPCGVQRSCNGTANCDESYPDTFTSCDDGLFCTDGDHCDGAGTCLDGPDSQCGVGEVCYEDEDKCCTPDVSQGCSANDNDVHWFDSCGHEGGVYSDCPDPNGECVGGACQCIPHWTGQLCDECEDGWVGQDCDVCVRYVDGNVANAGNGLSWVDAFSNVQSGIDAAFQETQQSGGPDVCEVWVAADTYFIRLSAASDTVQLRPGVELYGGFTTSMNDRSQRNWEQHLTVLNGWNSVQHWQVTNVVTGADNAAIDGFLIYGGNAGSLNGGGMLNYQVSPRVENCVFLENVAREGGGMYNYGCTPIINNCHFTRNQATYGGGMRNSSASPFIQGCFFSANNSSYGGGLYSLESGGYINNSIFLGNRVDDGSASMHVSEETVANCTSYGHGAGGDGNCIGVGGTPQFRNSILWDIINGQATHLSGADVRYSDVYVGSGSVVPGTGNIKSDPNFPSVGNGSWSVVYYSQSTYQTQLSVLNRDWTPGEFKGMAIDPDPAAYGWHIIADNDADTIFIWGDLTDAMNPGDAFEIKDLSPPDRSPVIDVGDACSAPVTDMKGNPRVDDTDLSNDGFGPPWVDMGALEWQDGSSSGPVDLLTACCGSGYVHGTHTYHFCPEQLAWGTAVFRCAIYNSYLVTIGDSTENSFVNSIMSSNIWIGANDIMEEGFWEWVTAENWTYEIWDTGQPDNNNNEDCTEMKTTSRWQDTDCRFGRSFVCEKPN